MKIQPILFPFFFVFFIFAIASVGQEVSTAEAYTEFYKYPREKIAAHLNKTIFLPGESIWFQAYLIDPKTGLPSQLSNNVYAGIFDAQGKLIRHKLLFAEEGIAIGNFKIDSTFTGNEFTLKMFTRWMLNFDENLDFNQQIYVVQNDLYPNPKTDNYVMPFKINHYSEGDTGFLENTLNNLIFTLTDAVGKKVEIQSGQVLDETGHVISKINETIDGIGRAAFFIKSGKKYTLQLTAYNGMTAQKEISNFKKQGIALTVNNLQPDKLTVGMMNNYPENTPFDSLSIVLAIEKDGFIYTKPLTLEAGKETAINLDKSVFTEGIYTAYLIKKGKIIAARPFFNRPEKNQPAPRVEVLQATGDSLQLQLTVNSESPFVFSVSLLPENTGALLNRRSLTRQLLGEKFEDSENAVALDKMDSATLDLHLITQGRSGDLWEDKFRLPEDPGYKIEKGISFRGKIKLKKGKPLKEKVIVFTESMAFQQTLEPDKDGNFESHLNYLEEGTVLKIALINDKKKLKKPELEYFEVFPDVEEVLTGHPAPKIDEQALAVLNHYPDDTSDFPLIEGEKKVTALKEVEVSAVKKEKILEHKPVMFSEVDTKGYKITNEEIKQFQYVTDFIRTKGYNVSLSNSLTPVNIGVPSISLSSSGNGQDAEGGNSQNVQTNSGNRQSFSNGGPTITSKRPPFATPTVYLDGSKLFDLSLINRMQMNIVDEIYIDYSGLSSGIMANNGGQGGIIYIITRSDVGGYTQSYNPETQAEENINNAFNPPSNYQSPNYSNLESPIFQKYGALDWKAFLTTDSSGKSVFTLDGKGFRKVRLRIEGLSSNGEVVSWEQTLEVKQ